MTAAARHGEPEEPSPWCGVELLDRAIGYTRGCLLLVEPSLMSAPTPCAGWDLRQLLAHMDDSLASLQEAGSTYRVRLDVVGEDHADPVESLRRRACALLADWSAQEEEAASATSRRDVLVEGRPVTAPVLTAAGALEVTVHGWDVSVACGAPRPIPDRLADHLMVLAPVLVTPADRPVRFAPPVDVASGASAGDRLLAFLGRDPHRH